MAKEQGNVKKANTGIKVPPRIQKMDAEKKGKKKIKKGGY